MSSALSIPPALARVRRSGPGGPTRSGDATRERPGAPRVDNGRSKTVALMIESDGPGGAEIVLLHLAEGLRSRGFRVLPILPSDGCGWLGAQFHDRGFRSERFRISSTLDPRCVKDLAELLKKENVSVVHAHEFALAVYGTGAAVASKIPSVITMHGGRYHEAKMYRRVALRWAAGRSRATVAVSRSTARDLAKSIFVGTSRIDVVPNGIQASRGDGAAARSELKLDPREPLLLSVGNLYPVKGHRIMARALAELRDRRPDLAWRAAIAGRGDERAWISAFLAEQGLRDRVHLLGYRNDVASLLGAADVFVLPSISEGLPLALLEAMLAGKPPVASRVGGVPEAIADGETGLLVPPERPVSSPAHWNACWTSPHSRCAWARQRVAPHPTVSRLTPWWTPTSISTASVAGSGGSHEAAPGGKTTWDGDPAPDRAGSLRGCRERGPGAGDGPSAPRP